MTTLLGSKRWIVAVAAAGALVGMSGCSASTSGSGEPASSSTTVSEAPTASAAPSATADPSAAPSATADPVPSPTASPTASSPGSTPSATPSASDAPAAGGPCTAGQLTGAVEDQLGGGAAGSVYRTLVLTNTSDQGCTMAGYPGVSFVDAAGTQLGAPADRDGSAAAVVTLAPGTSAVATLRQTNAQNYGDSCGLTTATGLRVYPPGDTASLVLPQEIAACSAASIALMTVGTLQPAS